VRDLHWSVPVDVHGLDGVKQPGDAVPLGCMHSERRSDLPCVLSHRSRRDTDRLSRPIISAIC